MSCQTMSRRLLGLMLGLMLSLSIFVAPQGADAAIVNFLALMSGAQEVPAVASPGVGVGQLQLNTVTNALSWTFNYLGLTSPVTAAHLHEGPVGVAPANNIRLDLAPFSTALTTSPFTGSVVLSDAVEDLLLLGQLYANIHTTNFPGGEIRGQVTVQSVAGVVPIPASAVLFGTGLVAWAILSRRRESRSSI